MAVRWWRQTLGGLILYAGTLASGCTTGHVGGVTLHKGSERAPTAAAAQVRRSRRAVAVVETDVGRGMGFVVDSRGYMITNRHVIEDADYVESVRFPDLDPERVYESVSVVYTDAHNDLALLHVHTDEDLPFVPLATHKVAPINRYVHESDGVVLFRRDDKEDSWVTLDGGKVRRLAVYNPAAGPGAFLSVSAPVARGQSGGPVLDDQGRAIGVVTWTWRDRVGGFAIPIAEATRMLSERPRLGSDTEQRARATDRSRAFLEALGRGDVDEARHLTSPSFARQVRGHTVTAIMDAAQGPAMPVLQGFVAAVEGIATDPGLEFEAAFDRLRGVVARTGADGFRQKLGLASDIDRGQIVSFFYEFGRAYLAARTFANEDPSAALESAMRRLQTVDAARTFALADAIDLLGGTSVQISDVALVPGAYTPRALVTLQGSTRDPRRGEVGKLASDLVVHLRLEWGDWYVAGVGPAALSDSDAG